MSANPRRKGTRMERECAKLLHGQRVQRVPPSGSAGGAFAGDVLLGKGWKVSCKARADGWKRPYAELAAADVLALRADRRPWLVVLPLDRLAALLGAERAGGANRPYPEGRG